MKEIGFPKIHVSILEYTITRIALRSRAPFLSKRNKGLSTALLVELVKKKVTDVIGYRNSLCHTTLVDLAMFVTS